MAWMGHYIPLCCHKLGYFSIPNITAGIAKPRESPFEEVRHSPCINCYANNVWWKLWSPPDATDVATPSACLFLYDVWFSWDIVAKN